MSQEWTLTTRGFSKTYIFCLENAAKGFSNTAA
jgi:hypothetical protein